MIQIVPSWWLYQQLLHLRLFLLSTSPPYKCFRQRIRIMFASIPDLYQLVHVFTVVHVGRDKVCHHFTTIYFSTILYTNRHYRSKCSAPVIRLLQIMFRIFSDHLFNIIREDNLSRKQFPGKVVACRSYTQKKLELFVEHDTKGSGIPDRHSGLSRTRGEQDTCLILLVR